MISPTRDKFNFISSFLLIVILSNEKELQAEIYIKTTQLKWEIKRVET